MKQQEQQLLEAFRSMPPEWKEMILHMALDYSSKNKPIESHLKLVVGGRRLP